jgi:hypothetical protein
MNNKYLVSEYTDELSANLFKIRLEAEGITTDIEGKSINELGSAEPPILGPVELFIDAKDAGKANEILKQYLKENIAFMDYKDGHQCPFCGSFEIGPDPWKKWIILLTVLSLGILFCMLFEIKKHKCKECGHRW